MKITIFGGGYVGLCSGVVIAKNHNVTVVDIDKEKVEQINRAKAPIVESGLDELLSTAVNRGHLRAVDNLDDVDSQDVVLICVDTPSSDDGSVDLSSVHSVLNEIKQHIEKLKSEYLVIGVRSTVPPTTTRNIVASYFSEEIESGQVGIVFQPEFLRQGFAIEDLQYPDRLIIGALDEKAYEIYHDMTKMGIERENVPVLKMSIESAELCKYASNSFLATKISFSSEIAGLAEKIPHVNVDDVVIGMTADHRICASHLKPGMGYGGSCLPKDVLGLMRFGQEHGVSMDLLQAVHSVNQQTVRRLLGFVHGLIPDITGKKVAVLGLAFKSGTDDTRHSLSYPLIEFLNKEGASVYVHDPLVDMIKAREESGIKFEPCEKVEECTDAADLLVIATDWKIYCDMGLKELTRKMHQKQVIDGRRMFINSSIPDDVIYLPLGG